MGDKTGIEWTDATWNPTRGCRPVSPGCQHCYAAAVAARFSTPGQPYAGLAKRVPRVVDGKERSIPLWTGKGLVVETEKVLAAPLRWKRPRRIFVNSMSDLFFEEFTDEQIAGIFGIMAAAGRHTFQVLTKRPERMLAWFAWFKAECADADDGSDGADAGALLVLSEAAGTMLGDGSDADREYQIERISELIQDAWARDGADGGTEWLPIPWPLPNVWIGVSVEDQERACWRIPLLLRTPAAVRFLSCEPLLGPVDVMAPTAREMARAALAADSFTAGGSLDWVIAGCESGADARPCEVGWLRSLRDQCAGAGVAFFLKQAQAPADGGPDIIIRADGAWDAVDLGISAGDGSHAKRGPGPRVIAAPYLDDVQHLAFPGERAR